jgi:superfamily II DNA or RNA helicase
VPKDLRPYQREAVAAVARAWETMRSVAIVMATGLGKTETFNHIAEQRAAHHRVLVIADRIELIESTAMRLRRDHPHRTVGIVMASRNQTLAQIVVGSVQTLRGEARLRQLLNVGTIIIDECDLAAAAGYRKIIDRFPEAKILGVTATFSRGDGRSLNNIFEDVVFQMPISAGIEQGYLVRPRGHRVGVDGLSLKGVRKTAGDYNDGDLDRVLTASPAPEVIAKALREHAPDDSAVCFTPGVHFAHVMHDAFTAAGFTSAVLHADTPKDERRRVKADVEDGRIQVVSNCGIWVRGTDVPRLKTAIIGPTMSNTGYIQRVGRVLRPYPGYDSALVLDYGGASQRFSLDARVELFGEDLAAELEREPCECTGSDTGPFCSCGRARCGGDCSCGGGAADSCGCRRPEKTTPLPLDLEPDEHTTGDVVTVEVDLFHGSKNHWLITAGGTWFLPAGERFIAVVPGRLVNTWSAVAMHRSTPGDMRWIVRDIPDKGFAMKWAEGDITVKEQRSARKGRAWRAYPPTPIQLNLAREWGVITSPRMHGGEVADLINKAQAAARMDARVEWLRSIQT